MQVLDSRTYPLNLIEWWLQVSVVSMSIVNFQHARTTTVMVFGIVYCVCISWSDAMLPGTMFNEIALFLFAV